MRETEISVMFFCFVLAFHKRHVLILFVFIISHLMGLNPAMFGLQMARYNV